jgi:hypothetical protein
MEALKAARGPSRIQFGRPFHFSIAFAGKMTVEYVCYRSALRYIAVFASSNVFQEEHHNWEAHLIHPIRSSTSKHFRCCEDLNNFYQVVVE